MIKREKERILKKLKGVSDDDLEDMYYDSVWDCLGSVAETMCEKGYDAVDIKEQERHEKYMSDYSDVLEEECLRRGIRLWEKQ